MGKQHQRNQTRAPAQGPVPPGAIAAAARCGGCQCFQDPPERPEETDATAWAGAGKDRGQCLRFPQPVLKRAGEFCFEFIARGVSHA